MGSPPMIEISLSKRIVATKSRTNGVRVASRNEEAEKWVGSHFLILVEGRMNEYNNDESYIQYQANSHALLT